eukprot:NODE_4108_length_495_cov_307.809417_g3508_i0.p1 GENE.NODE_4108_length_495_cov_307.809417_g3508_i0~~NODE_4108_length_495_cov_307.809417_g3508_i0.p1  ORF type:complete len:74 (+),score=15.74 NODE_4108_length_495_cov_307.809417_g3508_i0:80-301(+)
MIRATRNLFVASFRKKASWDGAWGVEQAWKTDRWVMAFWCVTPLWVLNYCRQKYYVSWASDKVATTDVFGDFK